MNRCVRCGKEVLVEAAKVATAWGCSCGAHMWKWYNESGTVYHDGGKKTREGVKCPEGLLYVPDYPCDSDMDVFAVIMASGFGGLAVLSGEESCK